MVTSEFVLLFLDIRIWELLLLVPVHIWLMVRNGTRWGECGQSKSLGLLCYRFRIFVSLKSMCLTVSSDAESDLGWILRNPDEYNREIRREHTQRSWGKGFHNKWMKVDESILIKQNIQYFFLDKLILFLSKTLLMFKVRGEREATSFKFKFIFLYYHNGHIYKTLILIRWESVYYTSVVTSFTLRQAIYSYGI